MLTSRLSIEPEFSFSVIGYISCILKILSESYAVAVIFEPLGGEVAMTGPNEVVRRCREDVEGTLAILR